MFHIIPIPLFQFYRFQPGPHQPPTLEGKQDTLPYAGPNSGYAIALPIADHHRIAQINPIAFCRSKQHARARFAKRIVIL